jgi:hypothetical protein
MEIIPGKKMADVSEGAYFLNNNSCPHMADKAVTWDAFHILLTVLNYRSSVTSSCLCHEKGN